MTEAEVVKCPRCFVSDYTPTLTSKTAVYYPPRIVNGENINPDRNQTTTRCHCNSCGEEFTITN